MKESDYSVLFSIITVCKNADAVLEDTLESVRVQTFRNFQLVVIDGKSTDKTLNILSKYDDLVDVLISEEDDGIFYAMNKGLSQAIGKFVYFLNAGDLLHDHRVLETVAQNVHDNPCDILYGDTLVVDSFSGNKVLGKPIIVDKLSLWSRTINHQSLFAKRALFDEVGSFDTSFKMKADHDWIIRCYNHSCSFRYVPLTIAQYDRNGYSVENWRRFIKHDRELLHNKNYSPLGVITMKALRKVGFNPGNGYFRRILDRFV